jgi:hypothetical protein
MTRALLSRTGHGLLTRLGEAISRVFERLAGPRDRYRPEKHYMRGPGPKSKHAQANKQEQE